jgi:hypothetical protein
MGWDYLWGGRELGLFDISSRSGWPYGFRKPTEEVEKRIPSIATEEDRAVEAFQAKLAQTAHKAVTTEMTDQIGTMKTWIDYTYCTTKHYQPTMIGPNRLASGYWQDDLGDQYPNVLQNKPIPTCPYR